MMRKSATLFFYFLVTYRLLLCSLLGLFVAPIEIGTVHCPDHSDKRLNHIRVQPLVLAVGDDFVPRDRPQPHAKRAAGMQVPKGLDIEGIPFDKRRLLPVPLRQLLLAPYLRIDRKAIAFEPQLPKEPSR